MHSVTFATDGNLVRDGQGRVYLPSGVRSELLGEAVERLVGPGLAGFDVTVQHKQAMLALVDEMDETASLASTMNMGGDVAAEAEIIVNATYLGMKKQASLPLSAGILITDEVGRDAVYVTTALPKGSGFSDNACGNPLRSRLKASSGSESVVSFEVARFRSKQYRHRTRLGRAPRRSNESAAKISPGGSLPTGSEAARIFGCQRLESQGERLQTTTSVIQLKGGAPDFLCRLKKTAVLVR
jgi:hypothetical protein